MQPRHWVLVASILAFHGVVFGAFGAHGLEKVLEENGRVETYQTAVEYHMYHALALFALAVWMPHASARDHRLLQIAGWNFVAGIFLFTASLYVLSLTNIKWLGAITPFGGLAFLIAWGLIAFACFRKPEPSPSP